MGKHCGEVQKTGIKTPKISFICQMYISLHETTYFFIEMQKYSRQNFIFGRNQGFSNFPRLLQENMHRIPTLWGNFIAEPFVIICKSSFVGKNTRSSWFALLQLISFRLQISYIMGNFSNGEKPTIWGTSHIKEKLHHGEVKKKV